MSRWTFRAVLILMVFNLLLDYFNGPYGYWGSYDPPLFFTVDWLEGEMRFTGLNIWGWIVVLGVCILYIDIVHATYLEIKKRKRRREIVAYRKARKAEQDRKAATLRRASEIDELWGVEG